MPSPHPQPPAPLSPSALLGCLASSFLPSPFSRNYFSCSSLPLVKNFHPAPLEGATEVPCLGSILLAPAGPKGLLSSEQRAPPTLPQTCPAEAFVCGAPSSPDWCLHHPLPPEATSKREKGKEIQRHTFCFSEICSLFGEQEKTTHSPPAQGLRTQRNGMKTPIPHPPPRRSRQGEEPRFRDQEQPCR